MNKKQKGILSFSLVLFIFILSIIITQDYFVGDVFIYKQLSNLQPERNLFFIIFTVLGGTYSIITIAIITASLFLLTKENKKMTIISLITPLIIYIINRIIKNLVQRPRPDYALIYENDYSFPSGHTMQGLATYGILILFTFYYIKNKKIKYLSIFGIATIIILIGISRIYLGVHYFSDVLAGFLLSLTYLIIISSIINNKINLIQFGKGSGESRSLTKS